MADWYVSSVAYAAIPTFAASHLYAVGDIIRPTSPANGAKYPQRCTTAGTSSTEPAWGASNNQTTTSGGATFTNVGGQSTYGWAAACGNLISLSNNSSGKSVAAGDRVYTSSDHAESGAGSTYQMSGSTAYNPVKVISVNRGGSVPPVAADIASGASITCTSGSMVLEATNPTLWHGFTLTQSAAANIYFNNAGHGVNYLKNCALVFSTANAGSVIAGNNPGCKTIFDNTTVQFGATGQHFIGSPYSWDLTWINTPSAIQGATLPTALFNNNSGQALLDVVCRGVDLSAITGTLVSNGVNNPGAKVLFDSCKINASVTRYGTAGSTTVPLDEVEFVNCFDGTVAFSERYTAAGALTTDTTTYMTGGAADDVGNFSHKMVSNANSDLFAFPLEGFWLDIENTAVGSSKTATVEIVSSASLNNTDIRLIVEYEGTASSPVASFADSLATVLTATTALTSSTATWNSPPSTPVYQKLQVSFTPRTAGRVRARVLLGKTSETVWVNPQVAIT